MTPAIGGKIPGHDHGHPAQITVAGALLTPATTVSVRAWDGRSAWITVAIELDEQDRIELIELLGGTP